MILVFKRTVYFTFNLSLLLLLLVFFILISFSSRRRCRRLTFVPSIPFHVFLYVMRSIPKCLLYAAVAFFYNFFFFFSSVFSSSQLCIFSLLIVFGLSLSRAPSIYKLVCVFCHRIFEFN